MRYIRRSNHSEWASQAIYDSYELFQNKKDQSSDSLYSFSVKIVEFFWLQQIPGSPKNRRSGSFEQRVNSN